MNRCVNLFPLAYRRRQIVLRGVRQWTVLWSATLAVMGAIYWIQQTQNHRARAHLEVIRRDYEPVKRLADEAEAIQGKIEELRRRESIVLSLADEQSMLTLIGLLSRAAKECDGKLYVQRLLLKRMSDSSGQASVRVLQLDGIAADNHYVARFAAALRDLEAFQRVELRSSGLRTTPEFETHAYSLECYF